jgi:hypothetical protein
MVFAAFSDAAHPTPAADIPNIIDEADKESLLNMQTP